MSKVFSCIFIVPFAIPTHKLVWVVHQNVILPCLIDVADDVMLMKKLLCEGIVVAFWEDSVSEDIAVIPFIVNVGHTCRGSRIIRFLSSVSCPGA